jgi:ATP-binding cassette, subfamily B, bacterial CvaB/MchF/RaxB
MRILDDLLFGIAHRRLPVILQTEAAECGLACLAMVATFHGHRTDLSTLRSRHSISLKGTTLADIIKFSETLHLASRPLRLELHDLCRLQVPCILHWHFDHYVVLKAVTRNSIVLHDPVCGVRKLPLSEFSDGFTGVALELWPDAGFRKKTEARSIAIRDLMGRVTGLFKSLGQVLMLALAIEVFLLAAPFYLQWVIDQVVVSADRDLLTTLAIGFGLIMVMRVIVGAIRSWVLMQMGTVLNVQWRANVFAHLMRLPVAYFQKRHLGDVNSRFGAIDQIQNTVTTSFVEAVIDGVMSAVTLIMMLIYSRLLAAIAGGTMLLYALCRWAWYGALRTATNSQIVFLAKQQSHFLESVRGVRAIKLFQREDQRRTAWLAMLVDQINAGLRTQKLQIVYSSINSLLIGIENILVIWFGARMILDGNFSVGVLIAFKAYDDQFAARASGLVDKVFQFRMLKLYGARLADIVLSEPERNVQNTNAIGAAIGEGKIAVWNLRFRYAEHEPFILNGITFEVTEGESIAIVGPSGCGKSTLMGVLLGVLLPTSGDVQIAGSSLQSIGPSALRQAVGSVMQDDVLFAGSIRENIAFFDSVQDVDWIEACARTAAIHEEIVAMPMGYNSLVGDMGTVLSGGQKQRVLLARALYKRPKILFLDEATSHLDVEKEREVNAAIKALNVTRIIVAHRPETIAAASRIIELRDGKIMRDSAGENRSFAESSSIPSHRTSLVNRALPMAPSALRVLPTRL